MRWSWKSVVEESFSNDLGLLRVLIVDPGVLFVVKWNAVPFDEIIVEVNWQHLRGVWDHLFIVVWQRLVVNVVLLLFHFIALARVLL